MSRNQPVLFFESKEVKVKKLILMAGVVALWAATTASAVQPPQSGPHYNLNIIGFSSCTMTADGVYPDCFNGDAGPGGHVIFVPLKTSQTQDICATTDPIVGDPADVTVVELKKGVRILVTDAFGDDLQA